VATIIFIEDAQPVWNILSYFILNICLDYFHPPSRCLKGDHFVTDTLHVI